MKIKRGFTLLELLIVVIIVGILASLAIPRYIKATESAKAAEAYNNLSAIRQAEWVYYGRWNNFIAGYSGSCSICGLGTSDYSRLAIEDPSVIPTRSFHYRTLTTTVPFDIRATRCTGLYKGNYITMDANGGIDESGWLR